MKFDVYEESPKPPLIKRNMYSFKQFCFIFLKLFYYMNSTLVGKEKTGVNG